MKRSRIRAIKAKNNVKCEICETQFRIEPRELKSLPKNTGLSCSRSCFESRFGKS